MTSATRLRSPVSTAQRLSQGRQDLGRITFEDVHTSTSPNLLARLLRGMQPAPCRGLVFAPPCFDESIVVAAVSATEGLVDNIPQTGSLIMDIETFELAPGCWILAIGVEREDRGLAGLIGKTATPKKYQAAWSSDGKWEDGKTMTFTTVEDAQGYRGKNLQRMMDASSEF